MLKTLYLKIPNEILAQHSLATRKQQPGESSAEYLQALKTPSKDCNFCQAKAAQYRDEAVRDAFISGIISRNIRQRLPENKPLDLSSAFHPLIARALDTAQKSSESYKVIFMPTTAVTGKSSEESTLMNDNAERLSAASSRKQKFCGIRGIKKDVEQSVVCAIDESLPFELERAASEFALAAALNQNSHPVALFSRTLHGSELKHHAVEKEAATIIEAVWHWKHCLTRRHFKLITDQKLGAENILADTLSRVSVSLSTVHQEKLHELHASLCHPGVTSMAHFVKVRNLPYTMEDFREVSAMYFNKCHTNGRIFSFKRKSTSGQSMPTWLTTPGPVLYQRHIRDSKFDPLVYEVELIDANPRYAHKRFQDGREDTVSLKDLAPQGNTKSECQYELKTQDAKPETQDAKPETQDAKPECKFELQDLPQLPTENEATQNQLQLRRSGRVRRVPSRLGY
eukprot:gene15052-6216_t